MKLLWQVYLFLKMKRQTAVTLELLFRTGDDEGCLYLVDVCFESDSDLS
jgi:hypothetical protein